MATIPKFEPEVLAALKARHFDPDKAPEVAFQSTDVQGVRIISRYQKHGELALMSAMVEALNPTLRKFVLAIACDSKAGSCFSVDMADDTNSQTVETVGYILNLVAKHINGGHNGIGLQNAAGELDCIDPDWDEDDAL